MRRLVGTRRGGGEANCAHFGVVAFLTVQTWRRSNRCHRGSIRAGPSRIAIAAAAITVHGPETIKPGLRCLKPNLVVHICVFFSFLRTIDFGAGTVLPMGTCR